MKDYLSQYGHAVEPTVRSFQAGGGMPAGPAPEMGAPAPAGPEGPEAGGGDLQAELMQVVETQDPQLALAFCNKLGEQLAAAAQGAPAGPPALLKRIFNPPKCSTAALIKFLISVSFETSAMHVHAFDSRFFCLIISKVSSRVSLLMSAKTTLAPCSKNNKAVSFPIPLPAPVITATLSCNLFIY
mgnify:CR=1 FL=1